MVSRNPVPYFGNPPAEYDQRYMNDLVRSFAQFTNQVTNPGEELTTALTVTSDGSTASGAKITWDVATSTLSLTYGAVTTAFVLENNMTGADILQAERVVLSTYGDTVSVVDKAKNLNKFGRTENADSGVRTTVAVFQGATVDEAFVSTNLINSIVSSNTGDTQVIGVEGHTIDVSGNLTFVVQDATLIGQTEVTLSTPLARVTRAYVKNSGTFDSPQAALAGVVAIYDNTDGIASGVPSTAAATKIVIDIGQTQTEKCATSTSSTDYWFLTSLHCSIEERGPAAAADFLVEARDVANGGVWRPLGVELSLDTASMPSGALEFHPFRIIPKNHDVRVVVISDTANTEVSAELEGYLAAIQV